MIDIIQEIEAQLAAFTTDYEKIDVLNALAWELREHDPQQAITLGQMAGDLAGQKGYQKGLAHSLCVLGYCNDDLGNYELALAQSSEASALFETLGDSHSQVIALGVLGTVYWRLGDYSESLECSTQALKIAEATNDRPGQAWALNIMNLGYDGSNDHTQALVILQKALLIYQELGDQRGQSEVLNDMAVTYRYLGDYPEALTCSLESLRLARETNNRVLELLALSTIGMNYLHLGAYDRALVVLQECLHVNEGVDSKMMELRCLFTIGKLFCLQQQFDQAVPFLQRALTLAAVIEAKSYLYECHQLLAEIHEYQKNFEQALHHQKQFHQIHQAVFNEEGDKKLKSLEVRYQTEAVRKEAEIQRLENIELEREIAERQWAEAEAQHRAQELMALVEVSREVSASLDLMIVLERITKQAKDQLQVVDAAIYLLQPDGQTLQAAIAVGQYTDDIIGHSLELGVGIIGQAAQNRVAEIVNKPSQDSRRIRFAGPWDEKESLDDDLYPLMVAPLIVRDSLIGTLVVWRHVDTGLFTVTNLHFLDALAQQAAIAIENARLFEAEHVQRQLAEQQSQKLVERTAELEVANASLQVANTELNAFAHTVAHDLKNPLGIITSYGDLLVNSGLEIEPDELSFIFKELQKSGQKAVNIVEELLVLASVRRGDIKMKPLNMAGIVEEAQQRIQLMAEEYQATIRCPQGWPLVLGYAPWIEEVWVNYLSNGLKYGGQPPSLQLGATPQPGGTIRLWVRDNGPGLTPQAQAALFTEFTRLDEVRARGYGLGLSIVRRIVEKLGGQVGVESEPGLGSTFYFTLLAA